MLMYQSADSGYNERLGFMRKALNKAKYAVYRGFVRPVLSTRVLLAFMGASQSTLNQLDQVQHRALI